MDLVVHVPRLPAAGETVAGEDLGQFPGGKGANQAVAAALAGAQVAMIGRVGQDAFGERLVETMRAAGVEGTYIGRDPAPTGVALIFVDQQAQNCIAVAPGANARVTAADVDAAAKAIASADVLLAPLEAPLDTIVRAIEIAATEDTRVVLNPAPAVPLGDGLLAAVDYLVLNESELGVLVGADVTSVASAARAARQLIGRGARQVLATLAERGSVLVGPAGAHHCPAFSVKAIDTTAAGDAYCGALAVALAEGRLEPEAMRFASAAAALAVTRPGAQPSLPRRAEIEAMLAGQA